MTNKRNEQPNKAPLTKAERKDILFGESGNRCMVCGMPRSDSPDWAMVRIQTSGTNTAASLAGRTILCMNCVGNKHTMGVADYAATLPFRKRLSYWLRVKVGVIRGRISKEKAASLLDGFHIWRIGKDRSVGKNNPGIYKTLIAETGGCCIYCGITLESTEVTYDHIVPRSLGGRNCVENYVIACEGCNSRKSNILVDDFIREFPVKKRQSYIHRVQEMVKEGRMPKEKGDKLLSFENAHSRTVRFRIFGRICSVQWSAIRV